MSSNRMRAISAALAAAVALTTMSFTPANASRRGDAAVLGAVVGLFGTIATIAAANAARDRYYDGPVYAPPVYGPRYYGGHPGWHGRHHHWHR
jgi:hypothetical protein